MSLSSPQHAATSAPVRGFRRLTVAVSLAALSACATAPTAGGGASTGGGVPTGGGMPAGAAAPSPDPRVGLRPGITNAGEAIWNMRLVSHTAVPPEFATNLNSDLAFTGNYVFQGNFNGYQVWDIANPASPVLVKSYVCPASQSDVSVYRNLLFVSGESLSARLDCGTQGVQQNVSTERLRGLRIFDISDVRNPRYVGNVQTCRGSHTHTLLVDPADTENVYVYVSGSAPVRSAQELAGCVSARPEQDPNTALFRIEVVRVPLARPEAAAIVSSPRIFTNLAPPPTHGEAQADIEAAERVAAAVQARGGFTARIEGVNRALSEGFTQPLLDSIARAGGRTAPNASDSAALRQALPGIVASVLAREAAARTGPTQCHDITLYPAVGLGGGACEGYGFLLDIRNPTNPIRTAAVADSNFAYWHSATFNNDGTKILFTDEWGGGSLAKCRATDRPEWGSNAIFEIVNGRMEFRSYYKLPAAQTATENCVAHNGSLVPIPGRDVMVQAWYQGGISVFDWTDARNPREIAFFDRGPIDTTRVATAGSWSAYWYNGIIVSSEIARGLDILELTPSAFLSQNEIDAAKTVRMEYLNPQGQPRLVWPPSFALARAYVDQLERSRGLTAGRITAVRAALAGAERASGAARSTALGQLAAQLEGEAAGADAARVRLLAGAVRDLAGR